MDSLAACPPAPWAATLMSQAQLCVQSAAGSSSPPPPSPWFSRGPIPTKPNTSCEVQVPFPGGPIRKEIKWLKASSLSRVVYLWSMGKIPTIESSFSGFEDSLSHFFTFDVNAITAAPFEVRKGKAHCTTQLSLSIKNE